MSGKFLLVACVSLLFEQSISALPCLPPSSPCAQTLSPCGANSGLGLPTLGSGANLGLSSPLGNFNEQILSVVSGSALTPSGLSVLADNLEINGLVGVQGSVPFLGTVGVAGQLPTGGQALVSYSAGPGVALTSGGCGQGLELGGVSGYGPGLGFGNVGLASGLGLANAGSASGLGFSNGLGLGASSCGCRY